MNTKFSSKLPPIFFNLSERPKRLIILSVGGILFAVLFGIVIKYSRVEKDASSVNSGVAKESSGVDWDKARGRTDMTDLKYVSMMVMEDIDTFKQEADKFHADFEKLSNSKKGESLAPIQGVIDYFGVRWKEKLPRKLMAEMYREKVSHYLAIANKVLRKEDGGEYVPQDIYDEIRLIGVKTMNCTVLYRHHNQLLDALSRKIGEGPNIDPKSIKAELAKKEDELVLNLVKILPIRDLENTDPSPTYFTGTSSRKSEALDSMDSLYRKQNQRRLDDERNRETKETLIRDTLQDESKN